jgi:SAM-dependent methyltransferase
LNNINDNFFRGAYKEVWRQTIPNGLTEAEADFIEDVAGLKKNDRVLDLMCGYGRHSIELARRGYKLTSIDIEPDYIKEIREKSDAEKLDIDAISASVTNELPDKEFDAVICMGNSIAFFPANELENLFSALASKMKPEGKLILNSWMIAEIAIRHFKEKEWHELKDFRYLISNKYFLDPARIESTHIFSDIAGKEEKINAVDYIFTTGELQNVLKKAGFSLENVFSTPRKKIFAIGDGRAYLVASRD